MVFIGSGGDTGGGGPSQLSKKITRMLAEVPETVKAITGIDIKEALASLAQSGTDQ